MARRKETRKAGADLKAFVNPRLMKGLEHVLRQHILMNAVRREVSPKELSGQLGEGLSGVSYHFRVLRDECGLIEETRRERRRGTVEHYYRATVKTLLPAKAFRGLRGGLRTAVAACMADDLLDDLAGALAAGKLDGKHDHVARVPLVLDEEGERNVFAIAQRARREAEREQGRAADRMSARDGHDGEGAGYAFAVFAFERAPDATKVDDPDGKAANDPDRR
jgi:hypothetical protein